MCDTMVALGNATADGSVIFAKNSDREANEAHELVLIGTRFLQRGGFLLWPASDSREHSSLSRPV